VNLPHEGGLFSAHFESGEKNPAIFANRFRVIGGAVAEIEGIEGRERNAAQSGGEPGDDVIWREQGGNKEMGAIHSG
jgi:hypothetical protein